MVLVLWLKDGLDIDFFGEVCYNVDSLSFGCLLHNKKTINNQIISDFKRNLSYLSILPFFVAVVVDFLEEGSYENII